MPLRQPIRPSARQSRLTPVILAVLGQNLMRIVQATHPAYGRSVRADVAATESLPRPK